MNTVEHLFSREMLERMLDSLILDVDSYKASQWLQYPMFTTFLESYIESRGGKYKNMMVVGLQMYCKKYLSRKITQQDIDDAEIFWAAHGEPFNKVGWEYILHKYNGYMPVKIKAVREGTIVPVHNVIVKVQSADKECSWLESYLETAILRAIWYPTTVATVSYSIKQVIKEFMIKTCDDLSGLDFKLHDFGARGVSSKESAGLGGCAHLMNFKGSDTVTGVLYSMYYYNMNKMTAFSVPASEHSTITSWMRKGEKAAYRNILKKFGGKYPIFACVSDSYNVFEATDMWAEMKDDIIKCGSMLVIRPDSGNPVEVVMRLILMLDSKFGHTMNKKGYRVLNHVRILWGDGIEEGVISEILYTLMGYGFSAENLTYGMGGALLQKIDRDTQKFAMKCSFGIIDDEEVEIYKDPITDAGKASKRGQQMLYKAANDGSFITRKENEYINGKIDGVEYTEALETIWDTGVLFVDDNFDQVRARAA